MGRGGDRPANPPPFTFCSLFEKWGHNSILARQRFWPCAPGHTAAARGWASAHSFPEVTPPGQTGLGSGGGSFYSACAVREAVYLTWPEAECWPCKHSLSYDTNRTCSQKKYLKNANRQKENLNDGKRKNTQGVRLQQGEGKEAERARYLNEQGMAPERGNTATHQSSAETPEQALLQGSS